jgi:hypothetical protein
LTSDGEFNTELIAYTPSLRCCDPEVMLVNACEIDDDREMVCLTNSVATLAVPNRLPVIVPTNDPVKLPVLI